MSSPGLTNLNFFRFFKISFNRIFMVLLILTIMSFNNCSDSYNFNQREFEKLLERGNLIFFLPRKYELVPVIENKQVHYDIAYKLDNKIEVRYSIWPYDTQLAEYNAYLDRKAKGIQVTDSIRGKMTEIMIDPNTLYKSFFVTFVYNITEKEDLTMDKVLSKIHEYPTKSVQDEFNADYGAYTFCKLDKEFGQEYKLCSVYMIHKKDCGMVVCFRLFKDDEHVKRTDLSKTHFYNNENEFYNMQFYKALPPLPLHPKNIDRIFIPEYQ